ncbi:MAG TPA: Stp1/IreP family PP2C-type Ser/Thr phosphatase [Thermoanaerobaculia bacterium]|nr:Stp1/IreP family PP2C-type Ser/Thr phosphatase [Thermoanaerobaculia bacterium]
MSESPAANGAASKNRLTVRAVLRTDVGKVRSENQDFATLTAPEDEQAARLMLVADGMGGHRGGATASRLAAETVKEAFLTAGSGDVAEVLRTALMRANAKIWAEAQSNAELRGMGTTTSALVVRDGQGWFGHVGDSRIYLVRGGEIRQLTDDHSLVASMVREGLLTAQEAEHHPRRNVLQRSMGVGEEVEIDVRGPMDLQEGDTFVVCSDGLHGVVKEEEIREIVRLPLERATEELVRLALEKGAPDNVTVIVARVQGGSGVDPETTVLDAEDRALFDDTVRETPPQAERSRPPDSGQAEGAAEGAAEAAPAPQPERPLSIVKWTLIFVLLLGAAGGGIFWAQQQRFARQAESSSR